MSQSVLPVSILPSSSNGTQPPEPTQGWKRSLVHFPFSLKRPQKKALRKLWAFLDDSEPFFLLGGYAGTGKSTIIFAAIRELIDRGKRVVLTAPTNKAVAILKKMAAENEMLGIPCQTIHQLLGLGVRNQGTEKILVQTAASSVHLYDFIFLDECSMVGAELWEWLERCCEKSPLANRKLVLMGDPAQLNPVGEKRSPTFNIKNRTILTEVVRQAGESPLLDFVTASRHAVKSKTDCFFPFPCYQPNDKSNGAFRASEAKLLQYGIKKVRRKFGQNPDCFRILCYTNKRVEYYNAAIHSAIYGQDAPQFVIGERLITKNPVVAPDGKTIILPTSCEIEVQEIAENRHYGYRVWQLRVVTDEGLVRQIFVLHESERRRYEAELEQKYQSAKRNSFLWRKYYWFRDDVFAKVWNCFALTVHNSQGSTFDEGAIDGDDLLVRLFVGNDESERQKRKEYNRLWYVGASRFRHRVLFLSKHKS